jgi:hypothetical protein
MIQFDAIRSLSEQLREIADHYAAADPDSPAWEAEQRAHRVLAIIATLTAPPRGRDGIERVPEARER